MSNIRTLVRLKEERLSIAGHVGARVRGADLTKARSNSDAAANNDALLSLGSELLNALPAHTVRLTRAWSFNQDCVAMHLLSKAVAGAALIFAGCIASPAHSEIQLSCDAFKKNPDGTWSPKNRMTLSTDGMDLAVGPGAKFVSGAHFGRLDLYAILERNCSRQ